MSSVPRFMKAIALGVIATSVFIAAAYDGPDYPPNYPFGASGNANHPNGYDGYPGNHPNNPNSPNGGPGGSGIGSGDGGQGGNGAPGGDGGNGGNSGPDGGHGGKGGDGGDGAGTNRGGDGGDGGRGVDGGGEGGNGGDSDSGRGGDGGDGGNATGDSRGGDGGDGGNSTHGEGGDGGAAGDSEGRGCGGDGGDGGDAPDPGFGGKYGKGDSCNGDYGRRGERTRGAITLLPFGLIHVEGMEDLAVVARQPGATLEDVLPDVIVWDDIPGADFDIADIDEQPGPVTLDVDDFQYNLALHPNSLAAERLRVSIDAVPYDQNPAVHVNFGANGEFPTTPSVPVPIDATTTRYEFTIIRPNNGEPLGSYLDLFQLEIKDVYVTRFEVTDLGVKGDLNMDQSVNGADLNIVVNNMYSTGSLGVEQGDANLDGVVDSTDADIVLSDIPVTE